MFVAWRDLRFAKGRFLLIGSVVVMITVLVGFLSGLTAGLANQNISSIRHLDADRIVFSKPAAGSPVSFSDSAVTATEQKDWQSVDGVTKVDPLGIAQGKVTGDKQASVALFGVESDYGHKAPKNDGSVVLSAPAAEALATGAGETISLAGEKYRVSAVDGDDWYSHTPVIWMSLSDWQTYADKTGVANPYATVLAIHGDAEKTAIGDTVSTSGISSLTAIGSFRSEIGSLLMMVAMLFGISALVIGAFFTVWTIQRKGDVAVLKALGASNAMLIKDALGQAFIVLVIGVGAGIGLTAVLGAFAGTALPFVLSIYTTILPAAVMILLGLAGAAFALRSVTSADPLTALGSNR